MFNMQIVFFSGSSGLILGLGIAELMVKRARRLLNAGSTRSAASH